MPNVTPNNTGQSTGGLSSTAMTISGYVVSGSGSERCIKVDVCQWKAADTAPSATFNGSEAFTVHDAQTIVEGAGVRRVTTLKLVNPSAATGNIVVSWGGATCDEAVIGATAWNNVDQAAPFSAAVKTSAGSGATSTINLTGQVGDVTHDAISADATALASATANQTQRWRTIAGSNSTEGAAQSAAGTGGSVAHTWTNLVGGGGGGFSAHIGVVIQQSSSVIAPRRRLCRESFGSILLEDGKLIFTE